ncbi:hypothetical protein [Thalassolituus sp. UBA2009]|jgi:hypothetical protein|uniref:hypothetical protein n=1 Tax=Thalassolituus sp. UBA2009 TaxID=1947658 RepID=UPI000C4BAB9B|nr:hypothetical protein [Thalassolituus sp. UBA2009]MAY15611.1 hypothetical protein [Oceanospirillaceae bacterium]|tara:strand:- start:845 stop:1027 length:183 start_codon:yes stop_codon:yes gene_type:complete
MDDQPLIIRTISSVLFPGFAGAFYFYRKNIAVRKNTDAGNIGRYKKNRPVAGFFINVAQS